MYDTERGCFLSILHYPQTMSELIDVIEQSVEMWTPPPLLEQQLELAARAGRVCYQSEGKTPKEEFLRRIIKMGHESVLEHASITFSIITNRAVTHQLVRHRIGVAYSQESQRYCNYQGKLQIIRPAEYMDKNAYMDWEYSMKTCAQTYNWLVCKDNEFRVKPEVARGVLPNDTKTQIVVTFNIRSLRHFLTLRLDTHAQYAIRDIASKIYKQIDWHGFGYLLEGINIKGLI